MEFILPALTLILVTVGTIYMSIGIKHDLRLRKEKIKA